jgi:hypothetical protein
MENAEARRVRRVHCAESGQASAAEMKGGGRGRGIGGSPAGGALQSCLKPWCRKGKRSSHSPHRAYINLFTPHCSTTPTTDDRQRPTTRCRRRPLPVSAPRDATAAPRHSEPVRRRNHVAYGCPPSHRLSDCAASAALPWCCWAHGLAERQLHPDRRQHELLRPAAPTPRGAHHGAFEHVLVPATRPRKARRLERGFARTCAQPRCLSAALAVAEHRVLCVATLRRQPQLPLELAHIALSAAAAAHHPRRLQAGPRARPTTRARP